ncbi:EcsC family protein [Dickeya oryzae]|uniref:EcsC family protein n=1 Tax=Dickeya oryzae TaxID=1240404 RepID=A0AB39IR74_9GAMM|nr:EcsC family protein [Dickeya oryzae]MCA6992109.1 EcsC family protein [Dickeya oryzae]
MNDYEKRALEEIHAWKNPQLTWFDKALSVINKPLDYVGDLILDNDTIGDVIKKSINGLVGVCNDAAQWSVRPESIFEEFRDDGHHHIKSHNDIHSLPLENIDKTVGFLGAKYKGLALTQGAGTGTIGLPGLFIDIPLIVTLSLRAIGEYATYYGFDIDNQEERLYAFNLLGLASSPSDISKNLAMAQLLKISQDVAKKKTWDELNKHAFVQVIQQISKILGIRLTKAKLAQVVPVSGAVVGGGFNAYFTSNVCNAAYYLYRERFLARKYGHNVIEKTVKPAEDFIIDDPEDIR